MKRVLYIVILFVLIWLPACGDLNAVGEEMAATRDAERPTPVVLVKDAPESEAEADTQFVVVLEKPTLAQAISGYADVSRAVEVLQSAEFSQHLDPSQQYTIFVPTDAAFAANSEQIAQALLTDTSPQSMWLYLTTPQALFTNSFTTSDLTTLHGSPLSIDISSGTVLVADAMIVHADIEFKQGVIHIIDRTVLP